MDTLALVIRGVVLIGAVVLAFTMMIAGFYLVLREYRLISNFRQLKEFVELTKDASLEADLAKRTISLSRTRPGLVMIGIGAVLLLACIWNPLKIENSATGGNMSLSLRNRSAYDKWLEQIPVLTNVGLEEQGKILAATTPSSGIGQRTFLALDGDTVLSIAVGVYGAEKFTPLIQAFNPNLSKLKSPLPGGIPIHVWLTGDSQTVPQFMIRKRLQISGDDPKAGYAAVFPVVQLIVNDPRFRADPKAYVDDFPQGLMGFLDGLKTLTGVSWSFQIVTPDEGETADTLARSTYGKKDFYPFLLLANTHDVELFERISSRTNLLPSDQPLMVIRMLHKNL